MTNIMMEKHKILDGEKIFRMYYLDMGSARSIVKVKRQLGEEAINPNTGRVVTDMAIWFSMCRWAMDNLELSYEIVSKAAYDEGIYYPKDKWVAKVEKGAKTCIKQSEKGFQKWQKRVNSKALTTNV